MKNILHTLVLLLVVSCFQLKAQEPGGDRPLASKTSAKGRRELRREERIKRRDRRHDKVVQREEGQKNFKAIKVTDVRKGTPHRRKKSSNKENKGLNTTSK
jgi:hypothetical protein